MSAVNRLHVNPDQDFNDDKRADMLPSSVANPSNERLTKRERFALAAMQGLVAAFPRSHYTTIAKDAFFFADAMLKESKNGQ